MSMMCKMNGACEAKHGMCVHEKMMMAMIVLVIAGVVGYFVFGGAI